MTHLTFNGKCISVADNEVHSPLTVGDLLTVLNSIFGNDTSNAALEKATKSTEAVVDLKPTAIPSVSTAIPSVSESATSESNSETHLTPNTNITTRWYVVTVGKKVGVFNDWSVVAPLVLRVSGACYLRYPSRQAAEEAFQRALDNDIVRVAR